ncbi:hypothetical protein KP509_03G095900 [Ceratopteris richardii]|uniref:Cytochrome b561 domain-containing protein n=1 Tax=Ceratopteris richardii TaxID=49495 RepID=A0A8T2VAA3_CERRI|nr:hypothetical protein KP509_03G095900 [Ceratopteris richardii]
MAGSMVGASVLIMFSAENGSNILPYKLTQDVQLASVPLVCSPVDLNIEETAVEIQGASMSLFAALQLPSNKTTLNHVWNRGSSVKNYQPQQHSLSASDLSTVQTINMFTAQAIVGGTPPHYSLKRAHGILNTVAWGVLLPIGVIIARYLNQCTESLWFYIHVLLQMIGYVLGAIGWALGMRLHALTSASHKVHQNMGIGLFVLGLVQMFALCLRPNKDHKLRRYWNVYHHSIGYTIILLGIINIFEGLKILSPGGNWKSGYAASLILMVILSLILEAITWIRCIKQRRYDGLQ